MRQGGISIADLLMAARDLPWETEEQLRQIAQSLGFAWQGFSLPKPVTSEYVKSVYDRHRYSPKPKPKFRDPNIPFGAPPAPELPIEVPPQILPTQLTARANDVEVGQPPEWIYQQTNDLLAEEANLPRLARPPLLPANTCRGVLMSSLRVQRTSTEPDVLRIIEQMVRGEVARTLPRTRSSTLEQGCQLLLDYSDGMVPYWEDLNDFALQVENVVGKSRLHVYEFSDSPLTAKRWETEQAWKIEKTRPVLVASNLGIGAYRRNPVIDRHWRQFIFQCEQTGLPLLFFIPARRESWPTGLGNYPILIHWNPRTTAGMVQRLTSKGHEVGL